MAGFDSLYTGISGLNAYQSWIDLISNNIANVDTVGFKDQDMTFSDMFYQNQSYASAPTSTSGGIDGQQLGDGVQIASVDTNWGEGGLDTTGVNSNLAINGDGFFILNNLQGSATPTYTRDGDFSVNTNGVLYDPASGLSVQGWMANSDGVVTTGGATGNITIPLGLSMQATATGAGAKVGPNNADDVFDVSLGGNLDQTQWQQSFLNTINPTGATNGAPYTVTTTVYDSLGNAHEATITYIPDTAGATAATYATAGAANASLVSVPASFSQNDTITITSHGAAGYSVTTTLGTQLTVQPGSTASIDGTQITMAAPPTGSGSIETINVDQAQNGLPAEVDNASGTPEAPATRWQVEVSFSDGTVFQTLATPGEVNAAGTVTTAPQFGSGSSGTIGYVYFNQDGQFINSSSIQGDNTDPTGTAYSIDTDVHTTGSQAAVLQGNQLNVTQWGSSTGNNASAAPPGAIALGYWQDASLSGAYTASVLSQNGYAAGTLENFTIGTDGTVTGAFTNGQSSTIAQIAIATFQNESGLERIGDNQYEQTANSGLAQVGVAGTGILGSIQSGALEESNVSLSTEFTNLIIAQRAFEANTRGITTADQNLQTIIALRASEN